MKKGSLDYDLESLDVPEYIKNALSSIKEIDFLPLKEGKYPLEDGNILIYSSYETRLSGENVLVEGHKKYIDVQLILEGSEAIGVLASDRIEDKSEYDEINDIWKAEITSEKLEFVELGRGDFLVLFPNDAHAPQLAVGKVPVLVKKSVIKVPVR